NNVSYLQLQKETYLHKEVFLTTGISKSSVAHILSDYNKTDNITPPKHSC
ncbi:12324_t:CDS:1, partial [Cetraspora pellucida]